MATYKVLQDIEAEDKFLGPLTLKQFIFAAITFICAYLSFFFLTKHLIILVIPLLPLMIVTGFLAYPWGRDQPTEVWLLAKIRFFIKPKRRIWNQSGVEELVTITVPKQTHPDFVGSNLSQTEVKSRLKALASTIDSRGWAIKNVNVNLFAQPSNDYQEQVSDRLIDVASLPQEKTKVDVQPADDILDERNNPTAHHLDQMISASSQTHRQETLQRMKQLATPPTKNSSQRETSKTEPPADFWFMNQPSSAQAPAGYTTFDTQTVHPGTDDHTLPAPATPTSDEQDILKELEARKDTSRAFLGHKIIEPIHSQDHKSHKTSSSTHHTAAGKKPTTSRNTPDPAILGLANNDDLTVATIAHEINKKRDLPPNNSQLPGEEVVIPLR